MTPFTSARGLWLTVLGPDALEALPLTGVGWLGVDLQHGVLEVRDLPGLLRVAYPHFIHFEWYVPVDADNHLYVGVMVEFRKGLKTLPFYAKYLGAVRWLFHGQFSGQDEWMVGVTDAPPEKLYRPDESLLKWRKLAEDVTEERLERLAAAGITGALVASGAAVLGAGPSAARRRPHRGRTGRSRGWPGRRRHRSCRRSTRPRSPRSPARAAAGCRTARSGS